MQNIIGIQYDLLRSLILLKTGYETSAIKQILIYLYILITEPCVTQVSCFEGC